MANAANVYVKNVLNADINARRMLPDKSSDLETVIDNGNEVMIPLEGTDSALVIDAPVGMDIKDCPIHIMKSDVDLAMTCSRTNSNWTIQIVPNNLERTVPTTVNVEVGTTGQ